MKHLLALFCGLLTATSAFAQSTPGFSYGQTPTAGQWNAAFASKQDVLRFTPLNQAGGTMTGRLATAPSTINGVGFSILPGIAPTAPNNGDLWVTTAGVYARVNNSTYNLSASSASGTMAAQNANAVAITGGTINGTTIGGTTPAPGSFTTLSATTPISLASGGTGATSISSALDTAFGSTQGNVLYRSASAWSALAPGTAGQYLATGGSSANPSWVTLPAGTTPPASPPQGRLTLTSGVPVLTTAVSAATSVLYTPSQGNLIPLWNGSAFVMTTFTERTLSTSGLAANNVYDVCLWSNSGTVTATFSPAWSAGTTAGSNAVRGSGTGSAALTRVNGLLVNANAFSGGPAAGYCTYVGTIATDASGATVSFAPGSSASGGGAAVVGLWNAFDRRPIALAVQDSAASHTYASATLRAAGGSNGNRITVVRGLDVDGVSAGFTEQLAASGGVAYIYIGLDSTSAAAPNSVPGLAASVNITSRAAFSGLLGLGQHFLQALEATDGSSQTFVNGRGQLDALATF